MKVPMAFNLGNIIPCLTETEALNYVTFHFSHLIVSKDFSVPETGQKTGKFTLLLFKKSKGKSKGQNIDYRNESTK